MPAEWTCPKCKRRFVTRNMWHSCAVYDLDHHFAHRSAHVRQIFEALVDAMREHGDTFEIVPQKTRICFMTKVRYGGCRVLAKGLVVTFGLPHREHSRRVRKHYDYGGGWIGHEVLVTDVDQVDEQLLRWLATSREQMGERRRLTR